MTQSDMFWDREGDAWLERNRDRLGLNPDPVMIMISRLPFRLTSVLEVGSANGWRLAKIRDEYKCDVYGVEPSEKGVQESTNLRIPTYRCVAKCLPLPDERVDVVILGFCLYVCDPKDYFKIAAEVDRVLKPGGFLIIHDFISPFPYFHRYHHNTAISCFHFEPHKLWLGNPCYRHYDVRLQTKDHQYCASLEKRHWQTSFLECPYWGEMKGEDK